MNEGRANELRRVWILNGAIAAAAIAIYLGHVRHLDPIGAPTHLAWWALGAGFLLAEIQVVHVQFRGGTHSLSLTEVPLVLGLVFAAPAELLAGQLIGLVVALTVHRRQPAIKLVFNVSQFLLGTMFAISLFHAAGVHDPRSLEGWAFLFGAAVVSSLVGIATVFAAISLAEGRFDLRRLGVEARLGLGVTAANASLGIMGVVLVWNGIAAAMLLTVPAATLYLGYRAYVRERHRREHLDFLHGCTRLLDGADNVDDALTALLTEAKEMFRAEHAEIVLLPEAGTETVLRMSSGEGELRRDESVDPGEAPWLRTVRSEGARLLTTADGDLLPERVRCAMAAPLYGETRVVGGMLVGNRIGGLGGFDPDELKLFETLASHASVSLENGRLEKSLAHLAELERRHKFLAFHDPLTGLANRTLFGEHVQRALQRAARDGSWIGVMFIDLDDFKMVNDSFGHAAGDRLLAEFADRLADRLRAQDIACRLGGDEFGVLLERLSEGEEAAAIAQRILDALASPFPVEGREVFVHASIGIVLGSGDGNAEALLRNADVAMYGAKESGKGCFRFFEEHMHTAVVKRLELRNEIERALERGEFVLHYQPAVDLRTGRIVGVEALIRWEHPTRGLVPPLDFVPLAEQTDQILAIGSWVIREATSRVSAWRAEQPGAGDLAVSVNVSARQLRSDRLVDDVRAALEASALDPRDLILEITESVLMQDSEQAIDRLSKLKALGVRIAIDDFGTGYSSLAYLSRLPVDIIKIDRTFVGHVEDRHNAAVVRAVVGLGRTLGIQTLAEGIEDAEQLEHLRLLGCGLGQGYLLSRPLDARDTRALLAIVADTDRVLPHVEPPPVAGPIVRQLTRRTPLARIERAG